MGSRRWDPGSVHVADAIGMWAKAVWTGKPNLVLLEAVLVGARLALRAAGCQSNVPREPGVVLLFALQKIQWQAISATKWRSDQGILLDLLRLAPSSVAEEARRAWQRQSELRGLQQRCTGKAGGWMAPIAWDARARQGKYLSAREQAALHNLAFSPCWTQHRLHRLGKVVSPGCLICGQEGTLWHRHFDC